MERGPNKTTRGLIRKKNSRTGKLDKRWKVAFNRIL